MAPVAPCNIWHDLSLSQVVLWYERCGEDEIDVDAVELELELQLQLQCCVLSADCCVLRAACCVLVATRDWTLV